MPSASSPVPVLTLDLRGTDHHGQIRQLYERGPVVRVLLPGHIGAWVLTRHELLAEWLRNPVVSKNYRNWNAVKDGLIPPDWPLRGMFIVDNMFTADGEDHRRLRGLIGEVFTPRRVKDLRPQITQIAEDLLDALPDHADSNGAIDLREHYALQVPMTVICALLGVPDHQREPFRHLVQTLFSTDTTPEQAATTERDRRAMLADLIAAHRRHRRDDLTSALLSAQADHPDILTEPVLTDTLWLLVTAGHETTLNLITNATAALLTHPHQKQIALTGGPDIWATVVEETLRWAGPIDYLTAGYPTQDVTIAGVTIPRGDAVLGLFSGLGHDPDRHSPDPELFDLTRIRYPHLAFGAGPHYCLGAGLARTEAAIALRALFTRHLDLTLAVPSCDLEPLPSLFSYSIRRLPAHLYALPS